MQKTLSTVASLGAIILFVSVAASSKSTLFILAVYGALFVYIGAPLAYGVALQWLWKRRFRGRPVPRIVKAMPWIFLGLMGLAAIYSFMFSSEAGREWSNEVLTSFGLSQMVGLVGLFVTAGLALAAGLDLRRHTFRECPHCLSRIRREATRCRYCTGEVDRVTERRHRRSSEARPARRGPAVRSDRQRPRRLS
jgi:hypothetical protein